jgi:hypothetical protein
LPLAVSLVEAEPLADADLYPGDLLHALLRVREVAWSGHPDLLERFLPICRLGRAELAGPESQLRFQADLLEEIDAFLQRHEA